MPRALLRVGSRGLARVNPGVAALMGFGLAMDLRDSNGGDEPLRTLGIRPRSATEFLEREVSRR